MSMGVISANVTFIPAFAQSILIVVNSLGASSFTKYSTVASVTLLSSTKMNFYLQGDLIHAVLTRTETGEQLPAWHRGLQAFWAIWNYGTVYAVVWEKWVPCP